jgi:hypothetical protein
MKKDNKQPTPSIEELLKEVDSLIRKSKLHDLLADFCKNHPDGSPVTLEARVDNFNRIMIDAMELVISSCFPFSVERKNAIVTIQLTAITEIIYTIYHERTGCTSPPQLTAADTLKILKYIEGLARYTLLIYRADKED